MEVLRLWLVMHKIYGVEMEHFSLLTNNVILRIRAKKDGKTERGKHVIVHVN
jgi:hypothetical protein